MQTKTIVLFYGLPGTGKSTLAAELVKRLQCPWLNADRVRQTLSSDLGFTNKDRLEQARRLGATATIMLDNPTVDTVVVDFVCPTVETQESFEDAIGFKASMYAPRLNSNAYWPTSRLCYHVVPILVDSIDRKDSRFKDTSVLFESALSERLTRIVVQSFGNTEYVCSSILSRISTLPTYEDEDPVLLIDAMSCKRYIQSKDSVPLLCDQQP